MPADLLKAVLDAGSFGLVAWMVLQQFRRQDAAQARSAELEATTARILAELTLQIARLTGASPLEVREAQRILNQKHEGTTA